MNAERSDDGETATADRDFTLPNGGVGPDPFTLSATEASLAVVFFHRDARCGNCRRQAARIARRYGAFRERDAEVIAILPEPRSRAVAWAERRDAPHPVLADADSAVADRYGQPTRLGALGKRIDLLGRMPLVVLLDLRDEPRELWRHAGRTADDRPTIDELLAEVGKFA
ncbi:redoxin domain-containing protein [Halorubrum vacuolatum]|uniref:Peroxiredoxin Q/BCP n=1 Tax=Halorubrum vacuolatum TaxID=63740 RepID=A0A238VMD0_HALVU|nr:redoxin domain-containing protein [Halorubrum vacuolatum]SNR35540.1 peroxiredoxin Q/BCP [Halorubrum vacuolatum]